MTAYEKTPETDATRSEWLTSSKMYLRAAYVIAAWAKDNERGTVLPDNSVFEGRLAELTGDEPSPSVWKRAKNYLVVRGVLYANDGPYQVALRTPAGRSLSPGDWPAGPRRQAQAPAPRRACLRKPRASYLRTTKPTTPSRGTRQCLPSAQATPRRTTIGSAP